MSNYLKQSRAYKKFPYNEMPPDMIEYLHSTTLRMLKEIVRVLDKNKIRYVAVGGTLLGAYTRQAFIPWDEDIDIGVFEEDYSKMIDCLITGLPEWMVVQCEKTEPQYYHEWIKVRDTNSTIYPSSDGYSVQGVWVDIYKLTLIKQKQYERIKATQHKKYLARRLRVGGISKEEYCQRVKTNHLNRKIVLNGLKELFNLKGNEQAYLIGTASKPIVETKYCFPLKEYQFEDMKITSFYNAEAYLKNHYGDDYSRLPPEKDRYISIAGVQYK